MKRSQSFEFSTFRSRQRIKFSNTRFCFKLLVLRVQSAAVHCFPLLRTKRLKRMASFDPGGDTAMPVMVKYPMRRLELSVKKFVKVLSIDLDRLHKHTLNIRKLLTVEDWASLHREQVNASRTVQQIKANMRELEKTRNQVRSEDLPEFDNRVAGLKKKSLSSLQEFLGLTTQDAVPFVADSVSTKTDSKPFPNPLTDIPASSPPSLPAERKVTCGKGDLVIDPIKMSDQTDSIPPLVLDPMRFHSNTDPFFDPEHSIYACGHEDSYNSLDLDSNLGTVSSTSCSSLPTPTSAGPMSLQISDLHVVPEDSDAMASWEILQENLLELNDLVNTFATEVESQGEAVNSIEENLENAEGEVKEGTSHLAKASKYKAAIFPVIGAVIGGVVGGPVGLFAGLKLGGLAAGVGGAVGFAGGTYMKKRQQKITNMEMKNLSDRRSVSTPEFLSRASSDKEDDSTAPLNPK